MATNYWVLVPTASEMNVAGVVSDAFIVTAVQGSSIDNELMGNYAGKVSVGGKSGYLRAGPYTTMAAAQAYLKVGAQATKAPIPYVNIQPSGQVTITNPLSSLEALEKSATDLISNITSAGFWIRIAEFLVGSFLLVAGVAHMTGANKGVLGKVTKAAPFLL